MTENAKLTGISQAQGQCDACGRELGRVFSVRYPDGRLAALGRRCAAKATGYATSRVEREADRIRQLADRDARREARRVELVEAGYGDVITRLEAAPKVAPSGCMSLQQKVLFDVLDGAEVRLWEGF